MNKHSMIFIGLDTHKEFHEVAYCEEQRGASAVHYGRIPSSKVSVKKLIRQFESKYKEEFITLAEEVKHKNMAQCFESFPEEVRNSNEVRLAMRQLDVNVNINWPLVHYKSAARYLQQNPKDIEATGGTNWQKYLPPRFQKRIFYPNLWSDEEKEQWGKSWVDELTAN
mgnify:CR=1 FL=1